MADPKPRVGGTGEADVRPSVALPGRGVPVWIFAAGLATLGTLLFITLESRRVAMNAPPVKARAIDASGAPAPPPALYIPPGIVAVPPPAVVVVPTPRPTPPPTVVIQREPAPPPQVVYVPQPPVPTAPQMSRSAGSPALVIDNGAAMPAPSGAAPAPLPGAPGSASTTNTSRAQAGAFANRATTVPQGTLIPAVLESALDSSRPGFARAIVSRDVRGFDGSRILIPRGSRLIGEYRSETATGQKRALINWTRLIRPDGATIAINSPAADTLGGTGIRASVNSHFFERFAGAILQSALNIGTNLAATRLAGSSSVIVALPGAAGAVGPILQPQQIPPTLKVRQGTSISIFVARDLDFTNVDKG